MKAGLFLALWEVATHVSIGGRLHILAGPTSGEQMELHYQETNSVLSPNEIFNIHLQRTLGCGVLGELAPSIIYA